MDVKFVKIIMIIWLVVNLDYFFLGGGFDIILFLYVC